MDQGLVSRAAAGVAFTGAAVPLVAAVVGRVLASLIGFGARVLTPIIEPQRLSSSSMPVGTLEVVRCCCDR